MDKAIANPNRQCVSKPGEYARLLSGGMFVLGYALLLLIVRPVQAQSTTSMTDSGEGEPTEATNPSADPAQAYRDFLAHPPWIKKIVFRRSGNYYKIVTKKGAPPQQIPGFVLYEGALQPSGYYLKHLSNSVTYRVTYKDGRFTMKQPEPGQELVNGESSDAYWTIPSGSFRLSVTSKRPEHGATPMNAAVFASQYETRKLHTVRRLGLDHLTNSTIEWIDPHQFSGWSPHWGPTRGRISQYAGGLPTQVQYSVGANSLMSFMVNYTYRPDRPFPPYQIVRAEKAAEGPPSEYTQNIEHLEVGLDDKATDGYRPSDFRSSTEPLQELQIRSNDMRFRVNSRGQREKIDDSPPDYSVLHRTFSRRTATILVLTALIAPSILILAWRWRRRNKKTPRTEKLR